MPGNTFEQVVALDFFHPDPVIEEPAEEKVAEVVEANE
jgi:hypothetical protein